MTLEHLKLISSISNLPLNQVKPRDRDQRAMLRHHQNYWQWIGKRIDYFQYIKVGYTPPDPLDSNVLRPFQRSQLDVTSRYYLAILNLVIEAFPIIQEAALSEGRLDTFGNPRELFAQICRDNANGSIAEIQTKELNQGVGLKELRKILRKEDAFYRDALPEPEVNLRLAELRQGDWSRFWIFAIWKHRHSSRELRKVWRDFKVAHRAICQFADKNDYSDGKVTMIKFNAGRAFSSHSMQPINSFGE
jgi:hypothetical protein